MSPMPPCHRLICASHWRHEGSALDHLLARRFRLARACRKRGLRCALLVAHGWLVCWVEGPAEAVEWALQQQDGDPSQRWVQQLHRSVGPATLEQPLALALVHNRERPTDVARRLVAIAAQGGECAAAEPAEIWQQLAAPPVLPAADPVADLLRRHVVVLTAEDNEAVDLLLQAAGREGRPLAYQRFAGGELAQPDVGAAYADLQHAGRLTRVHALSRRALAHPLVRLGLPRTESLVLLLGPRAHAIERLAAAVQPALAGLHAAPAVHLVGAHAGAIGLASAVLRQGGVAVAGADLAATAGERHAALLHVLDERNAMELDLQLA